MGWSLIPEQVITVSLDEKKQSKLDFVRMMATQTILQTYPQHKQINAALGIYPQATVDTITTFIQNIRAKVTEYESDISSAASESDLEFEVVF